MFGTRVKKIDELIRGDRRKAVPSFAKEKSGRKQRTLEHSYLGPTAHVTGDISLDENLQVEGQVDGTITIRGKQLTIGNQALVKASIHAGTVVVHGTVEGDVCGDELVHVHATAEISGSIYCKRIIVEDGARFDGLFKMSQNTAPKAASSGETKEASHSKSAAARSEDASPLKRVGG